MRARRKGVVAAHFGKAARATSTASAISSLPASGTRPASSPVAGLNTGAKRPLLPPTNRPLMKCLISVGICPSSGFPSPSQASFCRASLRS